MKNLKIVSMILFATTFLLFGCKKDYPEIGDSPSKVTAITGSWKTMSVTQIDYPAKEAGESNSEMDVTALYNLSHYGITFNSDKTFSVSGDAVDFIGFSSGTWAFDNDAVPSRIDLTQGGVTKSYTVVAPPREGWNWFIMSFDRVSSGKKILGYQYKLQKQS